MADMPHMRRREGDEYFCPRCSKRWGINEGAPMPCVEDKRQPSLSPLHQRASSGARPLTPATTALRKSIEATWRRVNGHPDHICLAATEPEWLFFEELHLGG